MTPPNLLDDRGRASMATMIMMSHHAFRRDSARFGKALEEIAQGNTSRVAALKEEWGNFHKALKGHHEAEDTGIFPDMQTKHPETRATIERLTADHHRMDTMLERADRAFGDEVPSHDAAAVVAALRDLFNSHLALEEAEIIPHLREAHEFPPPADENMAAMYADGFAWCSQGVAPDVCEKVYAMLPAAILSRLPAARDAFTERSRRVWGKYTEGASRTPVPDTDA
jgi:hemerythrin-like domain-containing protein